MVFVAKKKLRNHTKKIPNCRDRQKLKSIGMGLEPTTSVLIPHLGGPHATIAPPDRFIVGKAFR